MLRSLRARVPRIGRAPRLLIAGTCLLMALASALGTTERKPTRIGAPTVVAARDLPAGRALAPGDLRVVRLPTAIRPAGARADPADLLRRRLANGVRAREVITSARLVGAELAAGLGSGLVAAAVPMDDPRSVDLVQAGDRVDLLEAPRAPDVLDAAPVTAVQVTTAAAGVRVLAVLPPRDGDGAELIVAIDRRAVLRITRDRSAHVFTAVVVPP
jgi:Flp pilus assembly protein CpaB